jgi:hypothetical protein
LAQIKIDNPAEIELMKRRGELRQLELSFKSVTSGFLSLPPRERARMIKDFEVRLKHLQSYCSAQNGALFTNAGSKFTLENIKVGYQTLSSRWRIFMKSQGGPTTIDD